MSPRESIFVRMRKSGFSSRVDCHLVLSESIPSDRNICSSHTQRLYIHAYYVSGLIGNGVGMQFARIPISESFSCRMTSRRPIIVQYSSLHQFHTFPNQNSRSDQIPCQLTRCKSCRPLLSIKIPPLPATPFGRTTQDSTQPTQRHCLCRRIIIQCI